MIVRFRHFYQIPYEHPHQSRASTRKRVVEVLLFTVFLSNRYLFYSLLQMKTPLISDPYGLDVNGVFLVDSSFKRLLRDF